jgi:hypothetical protein
MSRRVYVAAPFLDMASLAMPTTMAYALRWCEFIFMSNGTYRQAADRILSYFITDVEVVDSDDEERERWDDFLNESLDIKNVLHTVGLDAMCFHGDTLTTTREGVFKLRDLAGKMVDVLSEGGVYRQAEFKSFGRQRLMEVEFSDGRTLLATPEHQWVARNCSDKLVRVPTTTLRPGYRIERVVAPRPERNEDFREGVRHGFTFGDGSRYNDGDQTRAVFFGEKDNALLPFFEDAGHDPRPMKDKDARVVHGLKAHYKELPEAGQSASYWYGFVCGFLAADGSVDTYGCALLTQTRQEVLDAVEIQLPRIGMVAGKARGYERTADLSKYNGRPNSVYTSDMFYLTLLKRFMLAEDFLIPEHRAKFEANFEPTEYGKFVGIKSVKETDVVDEVFCCVEMQTHTFVVGNGILTGNCYGNSFTSVLPSFKRYLSCKKCYYEAPLRKIYDNKEFSFQWSNFEFHANCPRCGYTGEWTHIDRRTGEGGEFYIKRWNPHEIELLWDPYTDQTAYIWQIPEDYRKMVREGHLYHLERANWEIIQAVKNNNHLLFEKDVIYHMREDALAGVRNRGWGISKVLANFRQAWYVQVLHRYNEAIALDYVIPFRLLTPAPGDKNAGTDPMLNFPMGNLAGRVNSMLQRRRRDPAGWNFLPFAVQYQALGGDATKLAPRELMDQGVEVLLNNIGVPVEFYKGSMQVQAAPVAIRLFESMHSSIPHNLNGFMRFVIKQASTLLSWETAKARLARPSHADDLQRAASKLQLMMGGQISQTTGLKSVGLEYREEIRRQMDDQRFQAEEQAHLEEEMQQSSQMEQMGQPPAGPGAAPGAAPPGSPPAAGGAAPPPGGDPNAGPATGAAQSVTANLPIGPNQSTTPEEMLQRAQYLATQIMGMPESQKDSELIKLKKVSPALHGLVKAQIEDMRQQAKTQGGAQVLAQQFGKQGGFAGLIHLPSGGVHVVQRPKRYIVLDDI